MLASLLGLGACSTVNSTASLEGPGAAPARVADYGRSPAYENSDPAPRRVALSNNLRSDAMPYGGRTAAPMGFLEMCSRSPMDCSHSSQYDPQRIRMLARDGLVARYQIAMTGRDPNSNVPDFQVAATGQAPVAAAAAPAPQIDRASLVNGFVSGGVHRLGGYLNVPADSPKGGPEGGPEGDNTQVAGNDGPAPAAVSSDMRPMLSWGAKASTEQAVPVAAQLGGDARVMTAEMSDQAQDYVRITMDTDTLAVMRAVNDQVNGIMRPATDMQNYGIADYWNVPALVRGVRGDCEDFALEKRRLLIEHGVPAGALSIAIVRTRLDEEHAVLVVTTDAGDYVLDNLAYDVRPWRRAGYIWVARQGPGDDLTWVSLATANFAPPMRAATVYVANAR
ncbi:transglutaminase-like cysteine peptidase [Asticcacaulis solisilvae]|uniref:transglutaminase-like cysteine peptidase n=1 Tax=Asticcacaulis solisilvae TaxID=1217274 RepID=UPI003FD8341F